VPGNVTVTPLTNAKVGVDAGVPRRSGQILVLAVRNVLVGPGIAVLLGKTKVNHVHLVAPLPETHQKVVRLDVPVNEVL